MHPIRSLAAFALATCALAASAASPTPASRAPSAAATASVGLDGAARRPGGTLADRTARDLSAQDVPSARNDPDLATQANADLARRSGPRLSATRQNLKGEAAAKALQEQSKPSTYDRSVQMGDKDHTQQVTNLQVTIKK